MSKWWFVTIKKIDVDTVFPKTNWIQYFPKSYMLPTPFFYNVVSTVVSTCFLRCWKFKYTEFFPWISEFANGAPFKAYACSSDIEYIDKCSSSYILFKCNLQIQSVLGKAVTNLVHVNFNWLDSRYENNNNNKKLCIRF